MNILFNPSSCDRPTKRFRNDAYERSLCQLIVIGGKKGKGMVFTAQQAADIQLNNLKVSADGSINTHNDVETQSPEIGQILVWDGNNWVNQQPSTSEGISAQQAADIITNNAKWSADGSINLHNDVQILAPIQSGAVLSWNGIEWTNQTSTGVTTQQAADIQLNNLKVSADGSINTHNDVDISTPTQGQILKWDGTNWRNEMGATGISMQQAADILLNNLKISADGSINTHNDMEVATPIPGDVLSWDGTNWTNTQIESIPTPEGISPQQAADILLNNLKISADGSINTHSDVETSMPSLGQVMTWDGVNWRNITAPEGISVQQVADILLNNAKVSADGSVNTHVDVQYQTPTQGDLLTWNGTNWVNLPSAIGISVQQAADILLNNAKVSADGSVNTHNDVQTSSPVSGQVLTWNGTNWVNQVVAQQVQRYQPVSVTSGLNVDPTTNISPTITFSGGTGSPRALANLWNGLPVPTQVAWENGALMPGYFTCWRYTSTDAALFTDVGASAILDGNGTTMALLGMENLYNTVQPYANPTSPTVPEQIIWCTRVLNHFRRLTHQMPGIYLIPTGPQVEAVISQRLCNEALWSAERWHTTKYGTKPANSVDTPYGFIPTIAQQGEYAGLALGDKHMFNFWNDAGLTRYRFPQHDGVVRATYNATESFIFKNDHPWVNHMSMILLWVAREFHLNRGRLMNSFRNSRTMGLVMYQVPNTTNIEYRISFGSE